MISKSILHYCIIEKLGEGGMGIVYKAEDTKLNREVAIKILPPHMLVSEDDRARFSREAKAAAALNHSNIATVYEINEFEGKPFIVMEYVDGKTLNDIVGAENLLPLQDAIAIALQVSEGLKAAHNKGIVHRDIKPSNILISTEKQAKILDFGLAKTSMSTKLTQMGTTIGTVAYMSPEQVQGKEVDHRTDLWSLGVALYEMISGRLPFAADYDQAIFYAIQNEEPEALTSIRSGVPMSLEWIVAKLMAKDAGERYQSANDLIIDLKAIDLSNTGMSRITKTTVQKPAEKSPKKEKRIDPYKPIAVVATLFLVYFIIHYFYQVNKSSDESLHFNISAIENNKVQLYKSDMQVIAISPDGSRIAYIVVEGGKTNIYVKSLKDFKITKLEGLGSVSGEPFFSPDGNYIGFNADGQLKRVSLLNRTVDVLINKPVYRGASWMDNNRIVYSQTYHSGLTMLNLSSGKETKLTDLDSLRGERTHRWPQVLPDGKHIIFTIGSVNSPNSYEDAELAILSLDDNSKHILSVKGEMARYLEPGYIIIGKDGKLLAAPFDLENYKFLSAPEPVLSNVEGDVGSGISFFGLSDNGNIVYVKGNRNQAMNIVLVSNKEESEILPVPANPFLLPRISPDGTKILVNVGTQSTARDIWIYDLQTELFRRLTFGMKALYPLWSNNKDGFYFLSTDKGNGEIIYQSLKDGSNKVVNSFNAGTATSILSVSPDDKYMFVNVLGDAAAWDLELLNLQNKESEKLNISGLGGNFSPDGRYLAYSSLETEIQEIYVTDFPKFELKWQISNDGGFSPRWSPDGKKLYYISMNGIMMELPVKLQPVFSPGKQNEIMDVSSYYFPSDNADNYDITPDGEHFIMIKNSDTQEQLKSFNMIYNWTAELDKIFSEIIKGEVNQMDKQILHYQIIEKLGQGGMGIVYKALDTRLKREVAIKFLPGHIADNEEENQRFENEAQASAALNHLNIAHIYSIEDADNQKFIVMEYVPGIELKEYLKNNTPSINEIVSIFKQLTEGMREAHSKGITHRDIKSANIMIAENGIPKIMDFGIAKFKGSAQVTKVGTTLGTTSYMSPEQARSEDVDYRSDLWSLGVVLYEMLTGELPFQGDYEAAIVFEILNEEPTAIQNKRPDTPDYLLKLVSKLLQKDVKNRIQSADEILNMLKEPQPQKNVTENKNSVAVLYFENMSSEKENEYFCAGITEDLIIDLSKIKELKIIPRSDILPFKNREVNSRQVGETLGVNYILEGSVRKGGNKIRITAQLIDIRSGFQVWAERYDRSLEDIFEIQMEVSQKIAEALKVSLTDSEKKSLAKKPTDDLRAYDFYMRGNDFLYRRGKKNNDSAIQMFEHAVSIDPKFPLAYTALAEGYFWKYWLYNGDRVWLEKMMEMSEAAIRLDPDLTEAQFSLGMVYFHQKRFDKAKSIFEKVISKSPDFYQAFIFLGNTADILSKSEDAVNHYLRAAEIKPYSEEPWTYLEMTYRRISDMQKALEAQKKVLELGLKKLETNAADSITLSRVATIYAEKGEKEKAIEAAKKVVEIDPDDGLALYNCACTFAVLNMKEEALNYLETALESGFSKIGEWVKSDPDLESINTDPKFQDILLKYNA